ncbi:MAG: PilL N-terminal domain-containing protein [Burkholderiaceae bacterium]
MPAILTLHRLTGSSLLIVIALTSGCASTRAPTEVPIIEEVAFASEPTPPEYVPVVRYGRYTLVELAAFAVQRDLLLQIVDVSMPENARASVGDGLRHVLKRSGYRLGQATPATSEFYALPLPAAHLRLGPMTLRDALLTLAGPNWELQIDDMVREIRFVRPNSGDTKLRPINDVPANEPVQTFPVTVTGVRS